MARRAVNLDPASDVRPADGGHPLDLARVDQRMTDIATAVTQISAQLVSLGRNMNNGSPDSTADWQPSRPRPIAAARLSPGPIDRQGLLLSLLK